MKRETKEELDKILFDEVSSNNLRCSRCGLIIPFVFRKGPGYSCPSFTVVEGLPVCYYCHYPAEYEDLVKKHRL